MNFYLKKGNLQDLNYPCVILEPDNWDDYDFKTTFYLTYLSGIGESVFLGTTKIITKHLNEYPSHDDWTVNYLADRFEELDNNFVSIGQDQEFYNNCKKLTRNIFEDILKSLRDCGFYRNFLYGFKHRAINDSLFRSITAEKLLNEARLILYSAKIEEAFQFKFPFTPIYNSDCNIEINFNFNTSHKFFPNRIFGIIGENGVGKTQIINALPKYIQDNKLLFCRIIHLTNSYFDKGVTVSDSYPEYKYFGLIQIDGSQCTVLTKEAQNKEIIKVLKEIIKKHNKEPDALSISDSFMGIKALFPRVNFVEITTILQSNAEKARRHQEVTECTSEFPEFMKDFSKLSSGESILLLNLIKILSCVTYNSLFLIDEPEIHLHPNFITKYMEYIYNILERFNSFAIIATHSTFVIREIKSDCVYILHRDESDYCYISNVKRQTFGSNAMALAIDIFENDLVQPYFINQLKKMKYYEMTTKENDVYEIFEYDQKHKLDLGIRMKIHQMFGEVHD